MFGVLWLMKLTACLYGCAKIALARLFYGVNYLIFRSNLWEGHKEHWALDENLVWVLALDSLRITYVFALIVPLFIQERTQMARSGNRMTRIIGHRWAGLLESKLAVKIYAHTISRY